MKNTKKVDMIYLFIEKHEEGDAEGDKKYGEYRQNLDKRPQDLQKHYYIDPEKIKSENLLKYFKYYK